MIKTKNIETYNSFLLNCIDGWVDIVLCYQRNTLEHVHDTGQIEEETTILDLLFIHKWVRE